MIAYLAAEPVSLITAIGLGLSGLGSIGSGVMALASKPKSTPQVPGVPAPATPPASQPAAPPPNLTSSPSFLSAAAAPPQANQPGKSLLGA